MVRTELGGFWSISARKMDLLRTVAGAIQDKVDAELPSIGEAVQDALQDGLDARDDGPCGRCCSDWPDNDLSPVPRSAVGRCFVHDWL